MTSTRIPDAVGATVFALLAGFAAASFFAWMSTAPESSGNPVVPALPGSQARSEAQSLRAELETESSRRAELALANRQVREEFDRVRGELDSRDAELEALRAEASSHVEIREKNKSLSKQLAQVRDRSKRSVQERNQLQEKLSSCEKRSAELREQLQTARRELDRAVHGEQLEPAGDFPALELPYLVNDPIELASPVRPLFIQLREYGGGAEGREKLYAKLTEGGETSALHRVPFEGGSSGVGEKARAALSGKLADAPESAHYLVVGYASADGEARANFELSSKRASAVAQVLAESDAVAEDRVEAVYFGQTKRFHDAELAPNRVVEVWRIE